MKRKGRDTVKNVGETAFSNTFLSMMLRCLECKKGVKPADNVVKFVGAYIKHVNGKGELFYSTVPFLTSD